MTRGDINRLLFRSGDFDVLIENDVILLDEKVVDAEVLMGGRLKLRIVGVSTLKGYCWYLTNLSKRIGPIQISQIYRVRWGIELSIKLDKSVKRMDKAPERIGKTYMQSKL